VKGVQPGTSAAEDLAAALVKQKLGEGLTPDEAARVARHRDIVNTLRRDPEGGKKQLDALVANGDLNDKEAAALAKRAGMSPLAWNVRGLSADDALRVFAKATDDQKRELLPAIHEKLQRSTTLTADERHQAQDRLLADAEDVDPQYAARIRFDREYADLKAKTDARRQYKKLLLQASDAIDAGNVRRARELRQQARAALAAAPRPTQRDLRRLAYLEARQARVRKVERQVKAGALTAAQGEARIARVVGAVA
jgi:hypothetical protein